MHRSALVLAVALPLTAADLIWKHFAVTPHWAYHPRGLGWLLVSLTLIVAAVAAARFSSRLIAVAAGVMVGGVLGNVLSAVANDLRVPDPIIILSQHSVFAFNLADIFTSTGILALTGTLAVTIVRNRHVLQSPRDVKTALERSRDRR